MDIAFDTLKIGLPLLAAVFAYFRFFREGTHKQRIQFDIEYRDLGIKDQKRLVEITVTAENKGFVEHRFDDVRVTLRGISGKSPVEHIAKHPPRLAFPETDDALKKISLIPEKWGYFFVRPKILQRFPLVTAIPDDWTHLFVRTTFCYQQTGGIHSAERVFIASEQS